MIPSPEIATAAVHAGPMTPAERRAIALAAVLSNLENARDDFAAVCDEAESLIGDIEAEMVEPDDANCRIQALADQASDAADWGRDAADDLAELADDNTD